jgi:tetratricopeptide (TPR) repeat protein
MIFAVTLTNCSQYLWPAKQVCITHHWLSNLGRVILYAENKFTIDYPIRPGQKYSFFYYVEKIKEPNESVLMFAVLDNYGTWFDVNPTPAIGITRKINIYDSPSLDLGSINQIEERGNLTQAIQHYYHYLHEHSSSNILTRLAEVIRRARGAEDALNINKCALKECSNNNEKAKIYQNLAENYLALEDFDQAIIHAKKALKNNHTDYLSLSNLGLAYAHKKNYFKAINVFNKLANRFKYNYPVYIINGMRNFAELISNNINKNNYGYITNFTKKLLDTEPYSPANYFIYVRNIISIGRYNEAEQVALDGIQVYPYLSTGYEILYSFYMQQQQLSKAINMKYKICELKPFCIEQHRQLLQLLKHEQRSQEAADLQKKINELNRWLSVD